jgi:hypothetical protein
VDVLDELADLEGPQKVTKGHGIGCEAGLKSRSVSWAQNGQCEEKGKTEKGKNLVLFGKSPLRRYR